MRERKSPRYPNRVREFRESRNLTLKQLAEASGLFFTQIAKIETGFRPARDFEFQRLAHALGVAPSDLFHLTDGGLSVEERAIISAYRCFPQSMRKAVLAMIESQTSNDDPET